MDRSHESDRARLTEKASADLARKNESLDRRIAFLKGSLYPGADSQPKYISYSPDDSRLVAGIQGEEFWFTVQPSRAKTIYEHWSAVKVVQRYEGGDSHERFLVDGTNVDPLSGRPRSMVEKQEKDQQIQTLLASAQQHYGSRMYEQAKGEYDRVLALDPNNQTAKDGSARSQQAIEETSQQQAASQKHAQEMADLRRNLTQNPKLYPGTWYDAATGLMWTEKDNGKDVDWAEARSYCQVLKAGNFSDWRLATIVELHSLYDPSTTKYTKGFPYHIKGDIALGEPSSWTSVDAGASSQIFVFIAGKPSAFPKKTLHVRTLCTRDLGRPMVVARETAPAPSAKNAPVQVGQFVCPGTVLGNADRLTGDAPGAPDRIIRTATRIVEVDPQGIGLFRVEGSPEAYFRKSGNPPQWSCSSATSDVPGGTDAVLTIRSGFPVRRGVQNALASTYYGLLRDDLATALNSGGNRVPAGMTPGSFIINTCKTRDACNRVTFPLAQDAVAKTNSDADGTGTLPGVQPGTYFIFAMAGYGNRTYIWNQRVELKAGANSLTLNQYNATETH
jgi:tetratricopeptide (TPR) repeat protein